MEVKQYLAGDNNLTWTTDVGLSVQDIHVTDCFNYTAHRRPDTLADINLEVDRDS